MKKIKKEPATKKVIKSTLSAAGFQKVKLTKVVPPTTTEPKKSYTRKMKAAKVRQAANRKAQLQTTPAKYKKALSNYGLGKAQAIIKKRGTYYAGAGLYALKKFNLKVVHTEKAGKVIDAQQNYSWAPSHKKGWFQVIKNGVVQKKLARWKDVDHEQKKSVRHEKIKAVAAKTGLTESKVKKIISSIRKEEAGKIKRFKRTKKFKKLSAKMKRRHTIQNRVTAVFGVICDALEVHGSPKPLKEGQEREWRKNKDGGWEYRNGNEAWAALERPKKKDKKL